MITQRRFGLIFGYLKRSEQLEIFEVESAIWHDKRHHMTQIKHKQQRFDQFRLRVFQRTPRILHVQVHDDTMPFHVMKGQYRILHTKSQ